MDILKTLFSNLRLATRQVLFIKVNADDYQAETEQVLLLSLFNMLFIFLCTYLIYLPNPEFNDYAVPGFVFSTSVLLLTAFLIERLFIRKHQFLALATIFISIDAVFSIPGMFSYWLIELYQYEPGYEYYIFYFSIFIILWFFIVILRATRNFSPMSKLKQAGVAVLLFGSYFVPASHFSEQLGTFWYASYEEDSSDEDPYDKVNVEDVFYQQLDLVHALRDGLYEERQDKTDLYFLGFASYATQDVFYKEVNYAQALMDSRFDTAGRSALLINHLKTYETQPLANSHNLKIMLDGMSERMNVEEDILFLYLTSHGGKKHNLSVDFWPLNMNDLTPEMLKNQLDDSGIKWRVVVVSACYSGGYIKPLEDENTLVFTAAAADKQSFGCSNENEFTWFGEAVFKFALNNNVSMIEAFEKAKTYIRDKEKKEAVETSSPQLSIGQNIEAKLRQYTVEIKQNYQKDRSVDVASGALPVKTPLPEKTVILNN